MAKSFLRVYKGVIFQDAGYTDGTLRERSFEIVSGTGGVCHSFSFSATDPKAVNKAIEEGKRWVDKAQGEDGIDIDESDDEFLDSIDRVTTRIEEYEYNENGVCLNETTLISQIQKNKISYEIGVAKCKNGWTYGYSYDCGSSLTSTGGHVCGAWIDGDGYPTREGAALACAEKVLDSLNKYLKNVPQLRKQDSRLEPLRKFIEEQKQTKAATVAATSNNNKNIMAKTKASAKPAARKKRAIQPAHVAEHKMIRWELIQEDPNQPRKHFDPEGIKELAADIKIHGIIQPIIVRPNPDRHVLMDKELEGEMCYDIVCGARRYRAGCEADLDEFPCIVMELSDVEAFELQISENLNRKDVNPMEESDAFQQLVHRGISTPELIADRFGVSVKYVYDRLTAQRIIPEVQQQLREGKITITHAKQFARLPDKDQEKLLSTVFDSHIDSSTLSVQRLREIIRDTFTLKLEHAPFDIKDAKLVKKAGPCTQCEKRSGCRRLLFEEVEQDDICFDKKCYDQKVEAFIEKVIQKQIAAGKQVVKATDKYNGKSDDLVPTWRLRESDDDKSKAVAVIVEIAPWSDHKLGEVIPIISDDEVQATGQDDEDDNPEEEKPVMRRLDYHELFTRNCAKAVIDLFFDDTTRFPDLDVAAYWMKGIVSTFDSLVDDLQKAVIDRWAIDRLDENGNKVKDENDGWDPKVTIRTYYSQWAGDEQYLQLVFSFMDSLNVIDCFGYEAEWEEVEALNKKFEAAGIDFFKIAKSIGAPEDVTLIAEPEKTE